MYANYVCQASFLSAVFNKICNFLKIILYKWEKYVYNIKKIIIYRENKSRAKGKKSKFPKKIMY